MSSCLNISLCIGTVRKVVWNVSRFSILSLAMIMLAAIGVTIIFWPSDHIMAGDRSIVVVAGASKATIPDALISQVDAPSLPGQIQNTNTVFLSPAGLTNEEMTEIDEIDQAVRRETRQDTWASASEKSIGDSVSSLSSIKPRDSTVLCGSESCFFSLRIPNESSDSDKQAAIEAVASSKIPDGLNGSLFTSRMFSEKQVDGSFIIRALIIRS